MCNSLLTKGLELREALDSTYYMVALDVSTVHPTPTSVASSAVQVSVDFIGHEKHLTETNRMPMPPPNQKSAESIRDLMCEFSKSGGFVLDTCTGTLSIAKAFQLLYKYRRFLVRQRDIFCAKT